MENYDKTISIKEYNEERLREIWDKIMIEIWSIIPTCLPITVALCLMLSKIYCAQTMLT